MRWEAFLLAQVAAEAPHALRLAAQLFDVAPCPGCDYIKAHCRCEKHEYGGLLLTLPAQQKEQQG